MPWASMNQEGLQVFLHQGVDSLPKPSGVAEVVSDHRCPEMARRSLQRDHINFRRSSASATFST